MQIAKKMTHQIAIVLISLGFATQVLANCYTSAGNPGHNRFGAGPISECNVGGFGSAIIGTYYNSNYTTNKSVKKAYKKAERDAKREYKERVRCVNKLLKKEKVAVSAADDHKFHLESEYDELRAAWENWYEEFHGKVCN